MSNFIRVTNNCKSARIHCAISWDGIQQDFRNNLAPNGGYAEYELNDLGDHDFTAVMACKDNEFKTENNHKWNIGRMLSQAVPFLALTGPIGFIAGVIGEGVALILDRTGVIPVYTLTVGPDGVGGGIKRFVIKDGANIQSWPLTIPRLHTPYGNNIVITGGDVHFERDETRDLYVITGIDQLHAQWNNCVEGFRSNSGAFDAQKP